MHPIVVIVGNDVVKRIVKTGDILIIPAGVPHGGTDISPSEHFSLSELPSVAPRADGGVRSPIGSKSNSHA